MNSQDFRTIPPCSRSSITRTPEVDATTCLRNVETNSKYYNEYQDRERKNDSKLTIQQTLDYSRVELLVQAILLLFYFGDGVRKIETDKKFRIRVNLW